MWNYLKGCYWHPTNSLDAQEKPNIPLSGLDNHYLIDEEGQIGIEKVNEATQLSPEDQADLILKEKARERVREDRWCAKCEHYKIWSSHHCSVCQKCVVRMDHHCPWLMTCIGYHNHRYFILFMFYILVATSNFLMMSHYMKPYLKYKWTKDIKTAYYFSLVGI